MTENYRNLSFWLDSVPGSLAPRPGLAGNIDADIAIIGAGYTGLWTAYYLKKIDPALKIVIVESQIAGFGASGRNGGWCAAYLDGITHWLDDPASRDGAIRLQRLLFDTVKRKMWVSPFLGVLWWRKMWVSPFSSVLPAVLSVLLSVSPFSAVLL